ncbi:hypothetical protein ACHAPO_003327 [Fusarium lateritium]
MVSDEKPNARAQQEQARPCTDGSQDSTSVPKNDFTLVPEAERVELRDREGHEMMNVTTASNVGTSDWAAATSTGGFMGVCMDSKLLGELAARVMKENNCSEIEYKIMPYDSEQWDEFAKTATHKRVTNSTGLNKDGTPQGPVDWEKVSQPKN